MKRSLTALRQQLGLSPREWAHVLKTAEAVRMLPRNWCRLVVLAAAAGAMPKHKGGA